MPAAAGGLGVLCLALVVMYLVLAWRRRQVVVATVFNIPTVRIAVAQVAIGTANFAFVAAILYQLLTASAGYAETVVVAYVLGSVTAWMSHVYLVVLRSVLSSPFGFSTPAAATACKCVTRQCRSYSLTN
jgi:hypothetical protein